MTGKLTVYIAVFILSALCPCSESSGVIHHIHPPDMHPPPRPPQQTLQKADFYKWKSRDLIAAFKSHGLEVVEAEAGLIIGALAAKESAVFLMPSYGKDIGGVVSGYESEEKLNESLRYHSALNINPGSPAWHIFRKDNILLLISGRVPEEKAREYEKVLKELGKE